MSVSNDLADGRRLHIDTINHISSLWIVLEGEADIATLTELQAAFGSLELTEAQSVHLHVKELTFIDAAGIRVLASFARRAREDGHVVMTCGAQPLLDKVVRLLSIHDTLGLS